MRRICLCVLIAVFLFSCNSHIDSRFRTMVGTTVVVPTSQMKRIKCTKYSGLDDNKSEMFVVNYIDSLGCISCKLTKKRAEEDMFLEKMQADGLNMVYIVDARFYDKDKVEDMMFDYRFEGIVYLDTCNAFLEANPHIPDNKLFHTFVINKEGKVLMVGNPFQNEKMEELFKKVMAKEKREQKRKSVVA